MNKMKKEEKNPEKIQKNHEKLKNGSKTTQKKASMQKLYITRLTNPYISKLQKIKK